MKTDTQLHRDVLDPLHCGPSVREAERAAWSAPGVVKVNDHLATAT